MNPLPQVTLLAHRARGIFVRGVLPLVLSAGLAQAQALLTNPDLLIEGAAATSVRGWQLSPQGTPLAQEVENLPEGVESALSVTATEPSPGSGALTQRIVMPAGASKLSLSGYIKSEIPRGGYIEVKLYKGKTELSRTNGGVLSAQYWQKVTINIDPVVVDKQGVAQTADKLEVLCRWYRQEKHMGGKVWFAQLRLTEVQATVAVLGGSTAAGPAEGRKQAWSRALPEFFKPEVVVERFLFEDVGDGPDGVGKAWSACVAARPSYVLVQCDWGSLSALSVGDRAAQMADWVRARVDAARAAGVPLVLVTPPVRRVFDEQGQRVDEFADLAEAVRSVAKAGSVPLVDLYELSGWRIGTLGAEGSRELYASIKDRTNLSKEGARLMAALVASTLAGELPEARAVINLPAAKAVL